MADPKPARRPRPMRTPPSKEDLILDKQFVMTDAVIGRIDRIRDLYTTFNNKVDLEALKKSGYIEVVGKMMEPITISLDERDPKVVAYWAKLGMVKEFHGDLDVLSWEAYEYQTGYHWEPAPNLVQNHFKRWNSFVPCEAFDPNNTRKFPVVFVLHGANNPASIVDGWGWVQEAARRRWIVIAPALELDDMLDAILDEAKKLYPVDESRVYACGFSYGGFSTNLLGNKRPDVYAAVAPCGAHMGNGYSEDGHGGTEPRRAFDGESVAQKMGVYMPIINIAGALDGFRFPYYDYKDWNGDPGTEQLLEGINHWARVNHAREFTLEEVMALKGRDDISPEEKYIGLPLEPDCRETVERDGITSYIASLKSEDGVVRTKIMCTMNMPHWPTPEMSRQAFEFFSHFSRDPVTKESIYTP